MQRNGDESRDQTAPELATMGPCRLFTRRCLSPRRNHGTATWNR